MNEDILESLKVQIVTGIIMIGIFLVIVLGFIS